MLAKGEWKNLVILKLGKKILKKEKITSKTKVVAFCRK